MAKRTKVVKESSETTATKRTPVRRNAVVPSTRKPRQAAPEQGVEAGETAQGPLNDEIARRAYQIYLHRGSRNGHDLEDWLEAERQLRGSGPR